MIDPAGPAPTVSAREAFPYLARSADRPIAQAREGAGRERPRGIRARAGAPERAAATAATND